MRFDVIEPGLDLLPPPEVICNLSVHTYSVNGFLEHVTRLPGAQIRKAFDASRHAGMAERAVCR